MTEKCPVVVQVLKHRCFEVVKVSSYGWKSIAALQSRLPHHKKHVIANNLLPVYMPYLALFHCYRLLCVHDLASYFTLLSLGLPLTDCSIFFMIVDNILDFLLLLIKHQHMDSNNPKASLLHFTYNWDMIYSSLYYNIHIEPLWSLLC